MKKAAFAIFFILTLFSSKQSFGEFKIVGYIPNWVNLTTFANDFDFSRVTDLCIAFKDPNSSGDLPNMSTGENYLVTKAHENGVRVFLSICGGASSTNSAIRNNYFTLINSTNRSSFSSKLKQYALNNNLDGIDLDLEGPAINGDYGAFVQVLADSLHPAGILLSAALSEGYGGANVPASTFPYFDWINIMAYDAKGPWNSLDPGQHSSYEYAEDALDYWKGRGLAKEKAILGVPFYGYGFGPSYSASSYSYKQIAASYPSAIYDDEAGNTIYFNGISTIQDKTSLAAAQGGGIMIWELSQDATGNNSLLKTIKETVDAIITEASIAENNEFSISPNPSSGIFQIKGFDASTSALAVYSAFGVEVNNKGLAGVVDISNEPKGVYYLQITKGNKTISKKIILL